jgi:hypothetical protein
MKSGLSEDPDYAFYRSLPIPWREIPNILPPPPPSDKILRFLATLERVVTSA